MFRKISWTLLFILVLSALAWNVIQWHGLAEKISSLEEKIKAQVGTEGIVTAGPKGQELILEMWHKIEDAMQDYKQTLREGKQQFADQQSGWNSLLAELKKSLQEYEKFVSAEGDFWEKQLKNYDKLLARTEERFEILGQVIKDLQNAVMDIQNLGIAKEPGAKGGELEEGVSEEGEAPSRRRQQITPQIKGGGEYKTYPPRGEEKREAEEEGVGEVIKGTITGTGEYKTY